MKNITLNYRKHTIEITKSFEKKASKYNSDEYRMLSKVRRENPDFRVVIVAGSKGRADTYKGLTYDYMKKYMEMKEDKEGLEMLSQIRKQKDDELSFEKTQSFLKTRKWFLEKYPELKVKSKKASA